MHVTRKQTSRSFSLSFLPNPSSRLPGNMLLKHMKIRPPLHASVNNRALERGSVSNVEVKYFTASGVDFKITASVKCQLGIITTFQSISYQNKSFSFHLGNNFCIFTSFGRWVSSVGVNFECRCQAFFGLNVGCRMKIFGNVGCRNNPFHEP